MRGLGVLVTVALILATALPAAAGVKVNPYGFVLVNAKYNTAAMTDIPTMGVATGADTSTFIITPRQTRFGLMLEGRGDWDPTGKIELDFWGLKGSGANGAAMQSAPRLRLAYFTITPCPAVQLLFGQNWSVFAPRNPKSLGHVSIPGFSSSGNLWNRFPQVTLMWKPDMGGEEPLGIKLSMIRPLAADIAPAITQGEQLGAGEKNGLPFFQGHVGYAVMEGVDVGVSFHFGQGDYGGTTLDTWAAAADFGLKSGPAVVQGEFFTGQNLRMLFSNANVSRNNQGQREEAEAMGGWGQLGYCPSDEYGLYVGAGYESTENSFAAPATRLDITNMTILASFMYMPAPGMTFSVEYGLIDTEWDGTPYGGVLTEGDNNEIGVGFKWDFK